MAKTFKQAVTDIENAERDVDKVLKAARLNRNPAENNERLEMILGTVIAVAGFATFAIALLIIGGVL